jgi:hypothetical protein
MNSLSCSLRMAAAASSTRRSGVPSLNVKTGLPRAMYASVIDPRLIVCCTLLACRALRTIQPRDRCIQFSR